jgi:hypothetical protein
VPEAREVRDEIKDAIGKRFKVKFGKENPETSYFLSANYHRHSPSHTSVSMSTYILQKAKDLLPAPLESYPEAWGHNPCGKELAAEYEKALLKTDVLTGKAADDYGTLVGVLQFPVSDRPDVAFPVGVGGRCRTFPTAGMYTCMVRVLVYLARTHDLAQHYVGDAADSMLLRVLADSDWHTRRSTTGFGILLACTAISARSRRQHAIAMSSCEAELMALADAALELLYIISVLTHLGHEFDSESGPELATSKPEAHKAMHRAMETIRHGQVDVRTDSKSAHDLVNGPTVGANSRHIERKVFKMKELRVRNMVKVTLIPTADNAADLLTKALETKVFKQHRATLMNLRAGAH